MGLCLAEIHVLVSSFQMAWGEVQPVSAVFSLFSFRLPTGSSEYRTFLHRGERLASNLGMFWSKNIWPIPVDLGAVSLLQAAQPVSPYINRPLLQIFSELAIPARMSLLIPPAAFKRKGLN